MSLGIEIIIALFIVASIAGMCLYFWKKSVALGGDSQKAKDENADNNGLQKVIKAQQSSMEAGEKSPDASNIVSSLEQGKAFD